MNKKRPVIVKKLFGLSVMKKVFFMVIGVILLMSSASILFTSTLVEQQLIDDLERRAYSISSDLASRSSEALLTDDIYGVYQLMEDALEHHPDVEYLFVVDENGRVLLDSFGSDKRVSEALLALHGDAGAEGITLNTIRAFPSPDGTIHDAVSPIRGGEGGHVRVGLNEQEIDETISSMIQTIAVITVLTAMIGLTVAYLLSRVLYSQIKTMVSASRAIADGRYDQRVEIDSSDELGLLADAYNDMSSSLEDKEAENRALMGNLIEKERVREQLLKRVITAQEEERKRIARELHDETSQTITSMIAGLKVVREQYPQDPDAARQLTDIKETAQHTLDELHYIAWSLRPSVLDDLGLLAAVERYIAEFNRKYGIDVDLHHQGLSGKRIGSEIEVTVYRVIQEALTNVARHSKAKEVGVVLTLKDQTLQLIIEDDGIGFTAEPKHHGGRHHLGLKGMQERVEDLGGTMAIESSKEQGTTIYVKQIQIGGEDDQHDPATLTG